MPSQVFFLEVTIVDPKEFFWSTKYATIKSHEAPYPIIPTEEVWQVANGNPNLRPPKIRHLRPL
jgi:hypothetical protein